MNVFVIILQIVFLHKLLDTLSLSIDRIERVALALIGIRKYLSARENRHVYFIRMHVILPEHSA